MKRRLWDLTAAISLLAFLAVAVMWPSSYWWHDEAGYWSGRHFFALNSAHGETGWVWDTDYFAASSYARRVSLSGSMYKQGMSHFLEHHFAGFGFRYRYDAATNAVGGGTMFRVLVIPYWFLALATAAPPAYWLFFSRRVRKRFSGGLCVGCGYDLRASSGRCPECGREF